MAEVKSSKIYEVIGRSVAVGAGVGILIGSLILGPIDFLRYEYNRGMETRSDLKRELLDYSRRDVRKKNPDWTEQQIEIYLAGELCYDFGQGDKIDTEQANDCKLWDAAENHARSWYQRWVWTSLDDD